ncbi:hypothetical protein CT0861_04455 [Colletotrichum tofieldiae]|uniref:HTH psq-type domain-containing protein n=1 Tax=Colletotrichum tofieldiae TaxID=708197 RepID=A0A161VP49_9PEZI|nr:hypothetical protein CT0861_04455 [Colletotrichum tofieldiae]
MTSLQLPTIATFPPFIQTASVLPDNFFYIEWTSIPKALKAISNGKNLRKAAREYRIPRITLQHRRLGTQARNVAFTDLQSSSPSQDVKLAEWVVRVLARVQAALCLAQPISKRDLQRSRLLAQPTGIT